MQPLPERLIGFKVIEELPFQETLEKYKNHHRLKVFYNKGLVCYLCGQREATRAVKTMDDQGGIHVDLYTNNLVLMNRDHIVPKSRGGTNELENLAPCCKHCNSHKSNMPLELYKQTKVYQQRLIAV